MQHTHATFVRGLLNPKFFGLSSVSDISEQIGTMELPDIPFSCISVRKKHSEHDMTYKVFSRAKLDDTLLDDMTYKMFARDAVLALVGGVTHWQPGTTVERPSVRKQPNSSHSPADKLIESSLVR